MRPVWLSVLVVWGAGCPWVTAAEQAAREAELAGSDDDPADTVSPVGGSDDTGPDPVAGDRDGDGVPDEFDLCPEHPVVRPGDFDGDGVGDPCDVCPLVADPGQRDWDGDGIGDNCSGHYEGQDHDGDGLDKHEERGHRTDDHDPDTDGDVLSDGAEVLLFGTDPLRRDTDGGGADDRAELLWACDPLDPEDDRGC